MSYQGYVTAAYLVFAVVLLWDFAAPRLRIRQLLRAARLLAARRAAAATSPSVTSPGELPR